MAQIIPNQKFKHAGETYEANKPYEVSPELAFYFKMSGWIGDGPPDTDKVHTLDVHDSRLGQISEVENG